MSKHVLRVLGLSLLVALGLMAFAAAGAQGANLKVSEHVRGEFKVLNAILKAEVTAEAEGLGRLLVPSLGMEITCQKFTVIEGLINNTIAKGHGIATVLFEECNVYAIEKALPVKLTNENPLPCLPLDSVSGKGGHIRATALVLVLLHENKDYLVIEQVNLETKPLAIIKFSPETGCPLQLKSEVFGHYAFEINTGDKHTGLEVKESLITAGNHKILQELLGLKLTYLSEAFLDGSAKLTLIGVHIGCTWGVL